MKFQLPEDLSALSAEDLDALFADALKEYEPLASIADDEIDDEQLTTLEELGQAIITITGAQENLAAAATERSQRIAAAKAAVPAKAEEEPAAEEQPETEEADAVAASTVPDDASELVEAEETEAVVASGKQSIVQRSAGRVATPEVPETPVTPAYSLIAAGDVPGISAGSHFESFDSLIDAFGEKIQGFSEGAGKRDVHNSYRLGKMVRTPGDNFIAARANSDDVSNAITAALTQYNLPGTADALVATGGWAAPSPINYDLPVIEEAPDGILALPTVTVERGGFQHTKGVDLSSVTADSNRAFTQTETQAIANTTKPFLTLGDVTFQDERLDVIGHGLRAKFLTLQGYPELVKRYVSLSNIAYIKYKNADLLSRLLAQSFTAVTAGTVGSVAHDLIDAIALQAARLRYKYTLKRSATVQGIAPFWLLDVIREDLAKRSGWDATNVADSYITGLLAQRGLSVQFVRDYSQDLGNSATAYPTTAVVHLWIPGTFIVGESQVVSFDAIYDYASIQTNTYTAFFQEEGRLLAKMTNAEAVAITVSTAASERLGRTGDLDLGHTFVA